jgi:nucleotidyltransferase substrate binding protein (TIGR01987 family)
VNPKNQDIRWIQRFENYQKALLQLHRFAQSEDLNELEKQGLIKAFEYTYELAWNVMKDYFLYVQANVSIMGSRDAIRTAFRQELIADGDNWMRMIDSRIASVHMYDKSMADNTVNAILSTYIPLFDTLEEKMNTLL